MIYQVLPPVAEPPPADSDDLHFVVRVAQKALGWLVGLGTAGFLLFYQVCCCPHQTYEVTRFMRKTRRFTILGICRHARLGRE
jgi:hypothetical protein